MSIRMGFGSRPRKLQPECRYPSSDSDRRMSPAAAELLDHVHPEDLPRVTAIIAASTRKNPLFRQPSVTKGAHGAGEVWLEQIATAQFSSDWNAHTYPRLDDTTLPSASGSRMSFRARRS